MEYSFGLASPCACLHISHKILCELERWGMLTCSVIFPREVSRVRIAIVGPALCGKNMIEMAKLSPG
eukprot:761161-Hanusia_phi.AAC.8